MKFTLKKSFFLLLILQLLFITGCKKNNEQNAQDELLPFSDKVVSGVLDNGLKFYIKQNDFPSDKIELRLNVRSGSLNETDEERGLAHFVEHMAFNGTKNFKGNDVIKFMEEAGLVFGKDTNASTSTDYTNYQLTVPYDNDRLINTAFLILKDWAVNITFDKEEIEKEKGVIIEEWRARNDVRYRLGVESRKHTLAGSLYPERDPIGVMDIVKGANKELLEGYYKKWYRPDNMAVIVVGNIDIERAKKLIMDNFADIPVSQVYEPASKNINYPKGIRTAVVSDKEAKGIFATLYIYHKGKETNTYNEFKEDVLEMGAMNMFARRMMLDIQEKKLNLLALRGNSNIAGDNTKIVTISGSFLPNTFNVSLKSMLQEIERVKRYGFTKDELNYFKTTQMAFLDKASKEDYNFPSSKYADQLSDFDTSGGYFTEFHQDKKLFEKVFNETNITSFNRAFQNMVSSNDMLLLVSAPENQLSDINISSDIFNKMNAEIEKSSISPVEETAYTTKLIDENIREGKIISRKDNTILGITEVVYENGVKLYIKQNKEEHNKFELSGKKLGGLSILPDDEYIYADTMTKVISKSGFENISKRNLDELLASKNVTIAPAVSEYTFDFTGGGFSDDIESGFQLIYKYFTAPVIDKNFLSAYINSMITKIELDKNDAKIQFGRKATEKMYNKNYRRNYLIEDDLKEINAEKLLNIYKNNYLDINNYTFAISGDVDTEQVISLGAKYLGSLKKIDKKSYFKDREVYLQSAYAEFEENGDIEPRTTLNIIKITYPQENIKGRFIAGLARNILSIRMREAIREKESGAYSVATFIRYLEAPKTEVFTRISFPCEPSRKDEVKAKTLNVYENFIKKGITEEELQASKLVLKNNYSTAFKENKYWINTLTFNNLMGLKVYSLDEINNIFDSLTSAEVNKFINDTLLGADTFISIFNPEQK